MKNLKVFSESRAAVNLQGENEELLVSALDVEQNRIFFASSANIIYGINLFASQEMQWTINLCLQSEVGLLPILEAEDRITGLDYLIEQEALIVGTSTGDLVLVVPVSNTVEVVGKVEGGVKTIASSPDGALLIVATGFGQLLAMTQDWDVLYEVSYDLDNNLETSLSGTAVDGISCFTNPLSQVRVSWRGDGKYFATLGWSGNSEGLQRLRIWERESGTLHSSSEPKALMEAALDWMPSGAKVAAACHRSITKNCTSVVFFERNGLERGSFDIYGPTEAKIEMLKWNCNSELLAVLVRYDEWSSVQIWSFSNYHWYLKQEWRYMGKNKLMFAWDPERPMHAISWTAYGLVHFLNLCWSSAVYDESIAFVIDSANVLVTPLSLSLVPPPTSLFNLKFQSAVQSVAFTSRGSESHLAAGLSDGNLSIVKFPSMDIWDQLEGTVYETANVDTGSRIEIEFGDLRHLTWLDPYVLLGVIHCDSDQACLYSDFISHNWRKCPLMGERNNEVSILVEIELVCNSVEELEPRCLSSSGWVVKSSMHTIIESSVVAIAANPMTKCAAFIQLRNGDIVSYTSKEGINMAPAELYKEKQSNLKGFLSCCQWMHAIPVYDYGKLKVLIFGLDADGRLQVDGRIICSTCTSFGFYASAAGKVQEVVTHLIYTTREDLLFVVNMDEIFHGDGHYESMVNGQAPVDFGNKPGVNKIVREGNHDGLKVWERGAKLIGIINGDEAAVILQTIRGNLETIYPRKLVLLAIAGGLVDRRFKDAVSLVRRHRINYNVIVDYCGWQSFVEAASEFVQQINNLSHITEFVCALKHENVMDTLYKNILISYRQYNNMVCGSQILLSNTDPSLEHGNQTITTRLRPSNELASKNSKVPAVLEAVRKVLEEEVSKSPARELCILTTLACNDPPELEEALKRIKKWRETEIASTMNEGGGALNKSNLSAEEALKHLLWLSDPDAVFHAALGLYDLHLAAIVALNSQRDPKEFLPFLQELEHMSTPIMCYTIDCKLHRYESALKNVAAAGDDYFEECLQLMKSNPKLFALGLDIFKDGGKRSVILEAWGDHLFSEERFEEAATAYCSIYSFQKALGSFRAGGLWKEALTMAGMLRLTTDEVSRLANDLCEELQALGKPAEAAKIALDYCKDVQSAINLLITAREWVEALRIGFSSDMGELVKSQVKLAAVECANSLTLEYEEGIEKVGKYLARYLAVRQRRLLLAAKLQIEDKANEDVDDDTFSETSSNISGMSAYTLGKASNTSGTPSISSRGSHVRTRIRTRRKPHGGKIRAGSPGEEFALLEHLQSMVLSSRAQDELKLLLEVLLLLGEEGIARKLQNVAARYQSSQLAAVKEAEGKLADKQTDETTGTQNENTNNLKKKLGVCDTLSWQWEMLSPP